MNLKQLKYFVTVAEELHFGRAAQRLHISQPPLSMSIQQLESLLGFNLFNRNNKKVALSDAGTLFYDEALRLLQHAEEMQQIGKRVALGTLGHLRIGFGSAMLFRGLNNVIHSFKQDYPHVNIMLKEMNSNDQIQAIKQEQISLGFVHSFTEEPELSHRPFISETFVCCLPKNHPLAQKDIIDISSLKDENFVLFPRNVASYYHDQITAICVNAGFSPHISHEVRNWLTIVELVEAGLGIAIVPESMQVLKKDHVRFIPIRNNNIRSEIYCVWKSSQGSIPLQHFLDALPFADSPSP